jgi:hypothetical protein
MMKDFGLHNALAFLATIVGLAVIGGVGLFFWRIADTWTPANTNFLTAALSIGCVVGFIILAGAIGMAIVGFSQRFGSGGRDEPPVPKGFQIVDGYATNGGMLPMDNGMYLDVADEKAGSFQKAVQIEDAWD